MKIKKIEIALCQACLDGKGDECHTPGCALFLHNSPGHEIMPELYVVLGEWEEGERDGESNDGAGSATESSSATAATNADKAGQTKKDSNAK